jgi:hypothetical protein
MRSVADASASSAVTGGGTEIQRQLQDGLAKLNVSDGTRTKMQRIADRWAALGQDKAVGAFTRITNALFGL